MTGYDGNEHLFAAHRYLCRRGAAKFVRRGLDRTDLEQVAAIGLLKAARRYDPVSRTPFEAYAWLLIVGELMHHVRDHEHAIREPRWVRSAERTLALAHERLAQRLQRQPTDAELASEAGIPPRKVQELRRAQRTRGRHDLEAVDEPDDDGAAVRRALAADALAAVDPTARAIVLGIYALGLTRRDIGRRYGLTARQVARAHDAALRHMRRALHAC
jgi:RNA polymerase sigma-B factor